VRADHIGVVAEAAYTAGREAGSPAAEHVLAILAGASRHVAAGLLVWDAETRRHQILASPGYPAAFIGRAHQQLMDGPVFQRLRQAGRPLRYDDPPYDFRELAVYRETLGPVGYGDGLSAALHVNGRYTGMLHMSAEPNAAFDDDVCDLVAALTPALAHLCDVDRLSPTDLDDDFCAQLVVGSELREVSGRRPSPVLTKESPIPAVAALFLTSSVATVRGLWADRSGWREVVLTRVRDGGSGRPKVVLVGDRPCALPYGLSPREVDVLTLLARGASNAKAAADLVVAPRTVATHVEHILDKLGCDSRAAAAARATREGIVRLDLGDPAF
jgi:DNA-binding CsgD family transcriptional regulator